MPPGDVISGTLLLLLAASSSLIDGFLRDADGRLTGGALWKYSPEAFAVSARGD